MSQILIVDDDPALLQALSRMLELRLDGVSVDTCQSPTEALGRLTAQAYDTLICDLTMPEMDGWTLIGFVREDHPRLPIILMSALLDPLTCRGSLVPMVQAVHSKPLDRDRFTETVQRLLVS